MDSESSTLTALAQRLRQAAHVLLNDPPPAKPDTADDASMLVDSIVEAIYRNFDTERLWMTYVAFTGVFPTVDDIAALRRDLELLPPAQWSISLLELAGRQPYASLSRKLRIIEGAVLVDVDHVARHDTHTGIQQVVRQTIPIWYREHGIVPVAWHREGRSLRTLEPAESNRALRWWDSKPSDEPQVELSTDGQTIIAPWHCVLVLPDAPRATNAAELVALACHTTTRLCVVGHDCIPILSPHLLPAGEADGFARWLHIVKVSRRVAGVSATAAKEFQGFADMLSAQGLPRPVVVACPLPSSKTARSPLSSRQRLVLTVGSFEPRKNHLAVLYAAERLWAEGLQFELMMIGGNYSGTEVADRVSELVAAGRPVTQLHRVRQDVIDAAYAKAWVLVFPSLHEGFGLPIAEAFAAGTPVITSDIGSMAEVAAEGGALLVDPRDDDAIVAALRRLLNSEQEWQSLRAQIDKRPVRSWTDYAEQLWADLVQPELAALPQPGPALASR